MSLFSRLVNFILPPRCPFCATLVRIPPTDVVCNECQKSLRPMPHPHRSNRLPVQACEVIQAVYEFGGPAREAIHRLKYEHAPELAKSCAALMMPRLPELLPVDVILPVPLSIKRLRERRYNQSYWLARPLAKQLNRPLLCEGVERVHAPVHQVGLPLDARWENVQRQFSVTRADRIQGRHILLVDDVVTTGATLHALAHTLLKSGAASVRALTFAQTL